MKDLVELFAACAGDSEAESVSFPAEFRPIDIVLKVVPTAIDLETGMVTLHALLRDRLDADSHSIRHFEYDVNFELPIEAIELAPKSD